MKTAIFLFDTTGYASEPFTRRGWRTIIIDILNTKKENPRASIVLDWDILEKENDIRRLAQESSFGFGFPPCTDLAVSGAAHFQKKRKKDPKFQHKAMHLALSCERIFGPCNVPYGFENPVSVLSTMHRRPDFYFHPYEFGGHLPENDIHPEYPEYIRPRDAYPKLTCVWGGNGLKVPHKKPVICPRGLSLQHLKLGGKSSLTKRIRSASPRGFFEAMAEIYTP